MKTDTPQKIKMPYVESQDYLDRLIASARDNAIKQTALSKLYGKPIHLSKRWISTAVASAAVLVILLIGTWKYFGVHSSHLTANTVVESPLDIFLEQLSEEEAYQLTYYEIEEIPEYYNDNN